VAWCAARGSYAELVAVPAAQAVEVPSDLPAAQAASALAQGMTAHYLAHSTYRIRGGDTVLIHTGAGGVGLLLTQMASRLGARVITTVSSETKARISRGAGASHVLSYDDDIARRSKT
jgi:NADPH2:quinone reductase